jgi:predicted acetyltransferase
MYLHNICTRPNYQRRGAATALVQWGFSLAERENIPVTLLSSSLGRPFYTRLGFRSFGIIELRLEGDSEMITITPMIKELGSSSSERKRFAIMAEFI